jgi:hypothetical protein
MQRTSYIEEPDQPSCGFNFMGSGRLARISGEFTPWARFNESKSALILIERARADQFVPAPGAGGIGLR